MESGGGARLGADEGGVVLVHALHGHAVGGGAGCRGERAPPGEVGVVHQRGPIDRADHDRVARAEEHIADGFEPIVDGRRGRNPAPEQRVPERRRDVAAEGRDREGAHGSNFRQLAGALLHPRDRFRHAFHVGARAE